LHYHQERVYQLITPKRSYSNKVSAHKILDKDLETAASASLPPSTSSTNALVQAIQDEYVRSGEDRRLLLLQQFLEYLYSQRRHKQSEQQLLIAADRMLQNITQTSSWFGLTQSEWDQLLPSTDDPHTCHRSLHPLAQISSYLAIERRKSILLWQEKVFETISRQVYDKEAVILTPDTTSAQDMRHENTNQHHETFSVVGSFTQDRAETIEATLRLNVQSTFSPLVEYYSLLSHLQDMSSSISSKELSLLFRSAPNNRNIIETLRVLTWLLAGTGGVAQTSSLDSEEKVEDEYTRVDRSLSMLKKLNIAAHCNIPSDLREKILSTTLRCLSSLSEKYLYLCLNRSSDGTLRENCGRKQMFIDLAGAFSELSLLLTDMYREGLIQTDGGEQGIIVRNGTKAHDYVNSLIFGKLGNEQMKQQIERQISHRNDLVETARWVLKLEMAILTEDWDRMDVLSTVEKPQLSLPHCPGIIEVVSAN
jgi:hypothetical protein